MANFVFHNPQPYPVGIADEKGTRKTIQPGHEFVGDDFYKKFVNRKSLQVKGPAPDSPVKKAVMVASEPQEIDPKAPAPAAKIPVPIPAAENAPANPPKDAESLFNKTADQWKAEAADPEFVNRYSRGQYLQVADFLGLAGKCSGKSGVDYAKSLVAALKG